MLAEKYSYLSKLNFFHQTLMLTKIRIVAKHMYSIKWHKSSRPAVQRAQNVYYFPSDTAETAYREGVQIFNPDI